MPPVPVEVNPTKLFESNMKTVLITIPAIAGVFVVRSPAKFGRFLRSRVAGVNDSGPCALGSRRFSVPALRGFPQTVDR